AGPPARQCLDLLRGDEPAIFIAQQVLEQHLETVWQPLDARDGGQSVNAVRRPCDLEFPARAKAIGTHDVLLRPTRGRGRACTRRSLEESMGSRHTRIYLLAAARPCSFCVGDGGICGVGSERWIGKSCGSMC